MKTEYEKLIATMDKTLSLIRKQWEKAPAGKEKEEYMSRINESLEERFRLMGLRDAAK